MIIPMVMTVIIVMKRGEGNKPQEEQVVHNRVDHHSLTSAQAAVRQLPLFIYVTFYGMEFPFG